MRLIWPSKRKPGLALTVFTSFWYTDAYHNRLYCKPTMLCCALPRNSSNRNELRVITGYIMMKADHHEHRQAEHRQAAGSLKSLPGKSVEEVSEQGTSGCEQLVIHGVYLLWMRFVSVSNDPKARSGEWMDSRMKLRRLISRGEALIQTGKCVLADRHSESKCRCMKRFCIQAVVSTAARLCSDHSLLLVNKVWIHGHVNVLGWCTL